MVNVDKVYSTLLALGVDFFAGVPDSLLKSICAYITDYAPEERNIITANEGSAVGIAAGYYLASGKIPLVYMQNSGLGNTVNPLLSLADEKVYSLPILLMIGWRGEPGIKDEPQHIKQGEVTIDLLDAMQVPYIVLDTDEEKALFQIQEIVESAREKSTPHAIVIRKDTFGKYKLKKESGNDYPVSREDALKLVIDNLKEDVVVVSTTGKLSRELFEYRETKGQGHEKDFLTVGSMGHSSSIALGIALGKKDKEIYCFDGDGAFIMHMGALSSIGHLAPENYKHILFNNGAHESVGAQPTLGFEVNMQEIAKSCGYKTVLIAANKEEILKNIEELQQAKGPAFLEIKVKIDSRDNLGRPTSSPLKNKIDFMGFLKGQE